LVAKVEEATRDVKHQIPVIGPGAEDANEARTIVSTRQPSIENLNMGLGKKKGHVHGSKVSGGHSTLIDGADAVVKKLGALPWFESVRPGVISVARGGKLSVIIRRHANATHVNTVKLIFRTKGSVQDVYLHVKDLETNLPTIVSDVFRVVGKELRGAVVYDRTVEKDADESLP
jgi:hypothetical protein